jgi:hypothetical protein
LLSPFFPAHSRLRSLIFASRADETVGDIVILPLETSFAAAPVGEVGLLAWGSDGEHGLGRRGAGSGRAAATIGLSLAILFVSDAGRLAVGPNCGPGAEDAPARLGPNFRAAL